MVNRYVNETAMRALAAEWRKAKMGEADWPGHALAFLKGARFVADRERAHDLVVDLDSLLDDLDARGWRALSEFLDLDP